MEAKQEARSPALSVNYPANNLRHATASCVYHLFFFLSFFIVLLDPLNAPNLCKHVLHNHFVQFNTSLLSLGHVAQRASKSHNYKWHRLDSFLARALTRVRTFNGSKAMSFSGMGRVTGYGRSRVQVLLYCWPFVLCVCSCQSSGFPERVGTLCVC